MELNDYFVLKKAAVENAIEDMRKAIDDVYTITSYKNIDENSPDPLPNLPDWVNGVIDRVTEDHAYVVALMELENAENSVYRTMRNRELVLTEQVVARDMKAAVSFIEHLFVEEYPELESVYNEVWTEFKNLRRNIIRLCYVNSKEMEEILTLQGANDAC